VVVVVEFIGVEDETGGIVDETGVLDALVEVVTPTS
jgi:hypothetical protein